MLMYWRLWRLYQLLLQFMNIWFHCSCFFPSLSAGTYSFELFEFFWGHVKIQICSQLCPCQQPTSAACYVPSRIHGQWLTNTTRRVCVLNLQKSQFELALVVYNYITIYYPRNWEKFTATDCWLMVQLQPEKNRIRHPAEATLATTSETLDRGDGLFNVGLMGWRFNEI